MLLIDLITEEAKRQGLRVQRLLRAPDRQAKRWLLIGGRSCQAIPARVFHPDPDNPENEAVSLYLPRTDWPEFLIYVVEPETEGQQSSFYVVPRGALSADTARAPTSKQLKRYEDAWSLLATVPKGRETARRFRLLSWALRIAAQEAVRSGLHVTLVPHQKKTKLFRWRQHRVYIGGRRCHVMSAPRLSTNPGNRAWKAVRLKDPKENWAEFIIYVAKGPPEPPRPLLFIVPRLKIQQTTTRTLSSPWLAEYANAWRLLSAEGSN